MKTWTKRDVVMTIAEKTGLTQKDVKKVIEAFISMIVTLFRQGNRLEIRNFGVFYPFYIKPRQYRIPRTGEDEAIEGRKTLRFRTSRKLFIRKDK